MYDMYSVDKPKPRKVIVLIIKDCMVEARQRRETDNLETKRGSTLVFVKDWARLWYEPKGIDTELTCLWLLNHRVSC